MKLKYKITLLIISITVASIAVLSIFEYHHIKDYSNNIMDNYLDARLDSITYELDEFLMIRTRTAETICNIVENMPDPSKVTSDVLKIASIDPYISDVYIGFENGTIISGKGWVPAPGYDPRKRDWYKDAIKAGRLIYTDPYLDLATNKKTISICLPIRDSSSKIIGVLVEDLLLESISTKLVEASTNSIGYGIIIDKTGVAVAHPDKDVAGKNMLEDSSIGTLVRQMLDESEGKIDYSYENLDKIILFRPLSSTGWIVGITVSKSSVYRPFTMLVRTFIISILSIIILVFLVSLYYSKYFFKPITDLKDQALKIAGGNLNARVPIYNNDEVAELSNSFNEMAEKLSESIQLLSDSEQKYKDLVENSNDFIFSCNKAGIITAVNEAFCSFLGLESSEIISRRFTDLDSPDLNREYLEFLQSLIIDSTTFVRRDFEYKQTDEYTQSYDVCICPIINSDGEITGSTGTIRDISNIKQYQNYIQHIAYHDSLTDLPNRAMLIDNIGYFIDECVHSSSKMAVIFIDIDNFKKINDTLGHTTGDMVIAEIATRILSLKTDDIIVTRVGGDEFTIVIKNVYELEEIAGFSLSLLNLFQEPFYISGNDIYITASIGISIFPDDTVNFEELLMYADAAMFKAKKSGKNSYYFYDDSINKELIRRVWIENGLRKAIANNDFVLYYQPIINLRTGLVCGAEALIRWAAEGNNIISPMEFIPISEETGQIHEIGEWALKTACNTFKKWKDSGLLPEDFILNVNMSPVQLKKQDIINTISRIVTEAQIEPGSLEIEITEGVFINEFDEANKILEQIRDLGIRIALDDFGTGFSSLSYLKKLNINTLKIDKIFVNDIINESKNKTLAGPIIYLVHNLNIEIIAEGVETEDQLTYLKNHLCNKAQGYIFSRPVAEPQFIELIKAEQH